MVGTWSHDLARAWIVVEATNRSGALGNLNLAVAIPCLFLIFSGGVLVDRTDVRKLMQRTKSLLGISSLVLACLAEFSTLHVWELVIFALVEGVITSFDSPAFQALTVRLVERKDFQQAIALNSTNFHASRMLGPLVAGWLMAIHGPSLVFLFDGLTYFVVVLVLMRVQLHNVVLPSQLKKSGASMSTGLRYIAQSASLRYRVAQLLLTIGCVYPLMITVFRVYVKTKFALDEHQFGTVFSFPAMGSMAGALSFAAVKPREPMRALFFGIPLAVSMVAVLPWLPSLGLTVAAMSFAGFGLYLTFASLTVSMQLEVQEEFRGRLSAVIGMGFSAIGPLMCFPWGHLADYLGAPRTIWLAATIFGLGSVGLASLNVRAAIHTPPSTSIPGV